jgi:DNA-directed RNA polymerase specialized sigma24 family protein
VPTTRIGVQLGDEAELYLRHHRALVRSVSHSVNASRELIEDACQTAWLILLRRQPVRERVFGWLRTVAIHEAYRLSGIERRDVRLDVLGSGDGAVRGPGLVADRRACVERQLEARLALERVNDLASRQRRLFALQLAGLSYAETAVVTGDSVRTVDSGRRGRPSCRAGG